MSTSFRNNVKTLPHPQATIRPNPIDLEIHVDRSSDADGNYTNTQTYLNRAGWAVSQQEIAGKNLSSIAVSEAKL